MSVAPALPAVYDVYVAASRFLHRLGVTTTLSPLPAHQGGRYDAATRTLHLNEQASTAEHYHAVNQVWRHIVLGPHASAAVETPRPPNLRLVR